MTTENNAGQQPAEHEDWKAIMADSTTTPDVEDLAADQADQDPDDLGEFDPDGHRRDTEADPRASQAGPREQGNEGIGKPVWTNPVKRP